MSKVLAGLASLDPTHVLTTTAPPDSGPATTKSGGDCRDRASNAAGPTRGQKTRRAGEHERRACTRLRLLARCICKSVKAGLSLL